MFIRRLWILLVIALILPLVVAAQDDKNDKNDTKDKTGDVYRLFATLPDTETNRMEVSFIDIPALFETRPEAPMPDSFVAAVQSDNPLWLAVLFGITNGPDWVSYSPAIESPFDFAGFNLFNSYLSAGYPPERTQLFTGIDASAVVAAHVARAYSEIERGKATLLCPPDGCDSGAQVAIADRNFDNVFGGHLGRLQPVIVWENLVISAMAEQTIIRVIATINGEMPSLADDPAYRFTAAILDADDSRLRQFTIFSIDAITADLSLPEGSEPLPPYQLFAFDDRATEESEITRVILIYDSAESAAGAADVLPARLDWVSDSSDGRTHSERIAGEDGVIEINVVEDGITKLAAVVISFIRPQPAPAPVDGRIVHSAEGYRQMFIDINRWELEWLKPSEE